jgi:alpha-galactosidase
MTHYLRQIALLALTVCAFEQTSPAQATAPKGQLVRMDIMDVSRFEPAGGDAQRRETVDGNPIKLQGTKYIYAICTYAEAQIPIALNGNGIQFKGLFGVDDENAHDAAIECKLLLDGNTVADSGILKWGQAPKQLDVDLSGAEELTIVIKNAGGGGYPHADIANGVVTYTSGTPRPDIERRLQDPDAVAVPAIASGDPDEPQIHGPRVTGTTPGRPFLFLIPATGKGNLIFSAANLPDGLSLDSQSGIITGAVRTEGRYEVDLTVSSDLGKDTRQLTIVAGDHKLAQTPPLGWNSWNAWGPDVTAQRVRDAADAMVKFGLAAKGFQYVNIDDNWEAGRGPDGMIRANDNFGDMKALADYVHSKGLKLGIYSSPGPLTCGKCTGSYQHELDDARWYAKNDIDYLKYDWCSYGSIVPPKRRTVANVQVPYRVMRAALDQVDRDIVYSMCQYGMGNVWQWGADAGGNTWRTSDDITDTWTSMADIGFNQADISRYSTPGHWNDPDMLIVGKVSWGAELHPTRLTPNEQLTHITLWSMLSAPLLLGCDLTQMDPFTQAMMTNPEVLAIDQDELGRGAEPVRIDGQIEIWKKTLFDDTTAVAVFNRGRMPKDVVVRWDEIGLTGRPKVRDLWQRKDVSEGSDEIQVRVPRHGAVLMKVGTPHQPSF